mmetsp:Transcript_4375/g.10360  ORF Transcript_4375/g.10360 Transcript_4375/m.10360 type:complete len:209 (-) Transcript_4375:1025-1651(-)
MDMASSYNYIPSPSALSQSQRLERSRSSGEQSCQQGHQESGNGRPGAAAFCWLAVCCCGGRCHRFRGGHSTGRGNNHCQSSGLENFSGQGVLERVGIRCCHHICCRHGGVLGEGDHIDDSHGGGGGLQASVGAINLDFEADPRSLDSIEGIGEALLQLLLLCFVVLELGQVISCHLHHDCNSDQFDRCRLSILAIRHTRDAVVQEPGR